MIQIKDQSLLRDIKNGIGNPRDIARYLMSNYTMTDIVDSLAEVIATNVEYKPIRISKAEFEQHFRIIGIKPDGTPEHRGLATKEEFKKNL